MNKILLTTVAVLLGLAASAQDSIPYRSVFGNEASAWHIARFIHSTDQGGATTTVLTVLTDTTQEPEVWHPVTADGDTTLFLMESGDRSRLYLRYPDDTVAHLLMDLNLQAGDTLPVHFRNGTDTLAVVDSVYYKDGIKHLRTSLTLAFSGYVGVKAPDDTPPNETQAEVPVPLTLIEGVGPNWGLDYGRESLDTILAVSPLLLCHHRDSARTYHQQVDTDYPRPDGSDNDSCSLEYIRYKSVFGKEESVWYTVWILNYVCDAGDAYTTVLRYSSDSSVCDTAWHAITKDNDTILYLRETRDHSKLYERAYGDSTEYLIMDLNARQGDSFIFHQPSGDQSCTIDSICSIDGVKYIITNPFIVYPDYALHSEEFWEPLVFIEGVGPICGYEGFIIYQYSYTPIMICCYKDNQRVFHNKNVVTWGSHQDDTCIVQYSWYDNIDPVTGDSVVVQPNPVTDYLTISNLPQGSKTIILQDIHGRTWCSVNTDEESVKIDLSNPPNQIYFLHIKSEGQDITKKIIKL